MPTEMFSDQRKQQSRSGPVLNEATNEPRRRQSRSRPVLVYTIATRSVTLEPNAIVEKRSGECLAQGPIARNPFVSEQQIEVPGSKQDASSTSSDEAASLDSVDLKHPEEELLGYKPTLVFKNIAPNMRWRRLVGHVIEWKVYLDPVM